MEYQDLCGSIMQGRYFPLFQQVEVQVLASLKRTGKALRNTHTHTHKTTREIYMGLPKTSKKHIDRKKTIITVMY